MFSSSMSQYTTIYHSILEPTNQNHLILPSHPVIRIDATASFGSHSGPIAWRKHGGPRRVMDSIIKRGLISKELVWICNLQTFEVSEFQKFDNMYSYVCYHGLSMLVLCCLCVVDASLILFMGHDPGRNIRHQPSQPAKLLTSRLHEKKSFQEHRRWWSLHQFSKQFCFMVFPRCANSLPAGYACEPSIPKADITERWSKGKDNWHKQMQELSGVSGCPNSKKSGWW